MCPAEHEQATSFPSSDTTAFGTPSTDQPPTTEQTTGHAQPPRAERSGPSYEPTGADVSGPRARTPARHLDRRNTAALLAALALAGGLVAVTTAPDSTPANRPAVEHTAMRAVHAAEAMAAIEPAITSTPDTHRHRRAVARPGHRAFRHATTSRPAQTAAPAHATTQNTTQYPTASGYTGPANSTTNTVSTPTSSSPASGATNNVSSPATASQTGMTTTPGTDLTPVTPTGANGALGPGSSSNG